MKENNVLFLTQAALIAAVYVVLCVVFAPISYGEVQVRVAEALVILPYFTPAAIPGLFIGCLLSNLIGGSILMDVAASSDYSEHAYRAFCTVLWIWGTASDSIYDADCGNWRSDCGGSAWDDTFECAEPLSGCSVWNSETFVINSIF